MTKYLIAFSNPSSPEKEKEFNDWYNGTHIPEVTALPSIKGARRYKTASHQFKEQEFSYVALYEVDDPKAAAKEMMESRSSFTQTDAVSDKGRLIFVEEIFEYYP